LYYLTRYYIFPDRESEISILPFEVVSCYSTIKPIALTKRGGRIVYISRENTNPSSFHEREQAFLSLSPLGLIWNFPWDHQSLTHNHTDKFIFDNFMPKYKTDTVICSDGELGIYLKSAMLAAGIHDVLLVSLDDFEESAALAITVYRQPYDLYAETIYGSLIGQNLDSENWAAAMHRVKGCLIIRD